VLRNPDEWKQLVENAKPIIYHVLDTFTAGKDINDPKTKSEIAARILPLINDVPNPVERDAYRQQVARVLQVDERALLMLSNVSKRTRKSKMDQEAEGVEKKQIVSLEVSTHENTRAMEQLILVFLYKDPEQLYRINRFLQNQRLDRLSADDFLFSEHQQLMKLIYQSLTQNEMDSDQYLQKKMAEEFPIPLDLPKESDHKKVDEKKELEDIIRTVMLLRQNAVNAQIQEYRFLQSNQAEPVEKADLQSFQDSLMKLIKTRGVLDKSLAGPILLD